MTKQSINQAMARLDGWQHHPSDDPFMLQWRREDREWFRSPPSYTEDLNAVARVVGNMRQENKSEMRDHLKIIISRDDGNGAPVSFFDCIDATAAQRCEAILRACGKWVEA